MSEPWERLKRELEPLVTARAARAAPGAAEEYLLALVGVAGRAAARGDYGIAAAVVVAEADGCLVSVAGNALFSAAHPGAHAEMNALAAMRAAISDGGLEIREWPGVSGVAFGPDPAVYRRPAGAVTTHAQISLYTTLEPCPMCTVALLNAGVNRVVVALADEQAGTLAPQRLSALPSVWPQLASERGLQVEFMDNDEAIAQQLGSILERSKPEADARLSRRGVLADTLADISEVRGDG